MIDHVWSLVCSRAVVDTESNNISIQNILERILHSATGGLRLPATEPLPRVFEANDDPHATAAIRPATASRARPSRARQRSARSR